MVRYTGRQKTITGSVNRNQVGLKMSGCPSRVGRSGKNLRLLGRRVNCMYGLCGPTMVNGAPWRTSGRNEPPFCRQRSTSCAQAAGGVGHINSPYTRTRVPAAGKQGCTQIGTTVLDPDTALRLLKSYFHQTLGGTGSVILVGKKETLVGDGITAHFDEIKHYYGGTSEYSALPAHIKKAVDVINNLKIMGSLTVGEPAVPHVVGWETWDGQTALHKAQYGRQVSVGSESVTMFATCPGGCADAKDALRWQFYTTMVTAGPATIGPWFYFTMKYNANYGGGCQVIGGVPGVQAGKLSCVSDSAAWNDISTHITAINNNSSDPTYMDSMFITFLAMADNDLYRQGYTNLRQEVTGTANPVTWAGATKYSPISQCFMEYLIEYWGYNDDQAGGCDWLSSSSSSKQDQMGWPPCVQNISYCGP